MKNLNETIGNRTRDLPVCKAVPHPVAPPAACSDPALIQFLLREKIKLSSIRKKIRFLEVLTVMFVLSPLSYGVTCICLCYVVEICRNPLDNPDAFKRDISFLILSLTINKRPSIAFYMSVLYFPSQYKR
jgi:hypothetical protein